MQLSRFRVQYSLITVPRIIYKILLLSLSLNLPLNLLLNLSGQISENPVKKSHLKPELIPNSSFKPSHSFADEILKSKNYEIENVEFDNSEKNTIEDTSIDFYNGYENKNLKLRDLIIAESILNRPYK